jgi:DNA-binding response OmpR family regulator
LISNNKDNNDNNKNKNNNNNNNRILLVDDEHDITALFTMGLEDSGFKVDAFNDPLHALSGFKRGSYDIALIDFKMPNLNGFELYREIRKIDGEIKVCFITAFEIYHDELKKKFQSNLNTSSQHKQEEVDVKCFIHKPVEIDELIRRIREELNS